MKDTATDVLDEQESGSEDAGKQFRTLEKMFRKSTRERKGPQRFEHSAMIAVEDPEKMEEVIERLHRK